MNGIHHLYIDLETYSDVDISKAGLYRYAQSPAFELLLMSYSLDGGPVQTIDLAQGEEIPLDVKQHLFHPDTVKHAFNAAFEWYCLGTALSQPCAAWLNQWRCTMLHSLYCGYPGSLAGAGAALGLEEDKRKMGVGRALIRYFCVPCAPTKSNGGRTRNLPRHDPAKWALFKEYNARDVEAELEIERRLSAFPVPGEVQAQWVTDQTINLRGVAVDTALVSGALELDQNVRARCAEEAAGITGLSNPNSPGQLAEWLRRETGLEVPDLTKATVSELLAGELPGGKARRALELRQEMSRTSTKKYNALETAVCADGRVRGLLQFYGANRTGRWAGRIVQPQNLPRTYIGGELLPLARELVKAGNAPGLRLVFGSVPDTLSQLIRTAFVASPGNTLVDADFSAIEARVIAWLAGEEWVLEVFRTHGRIYEATAAQMFGVPLDRIKKGNPEYSYRQRGKVATLALGYQGGVAAMRAMDTSKALAKLPDEEILDMVQLWRQANPRIVQLWYAVEAAAKEAVERGRSVPLRGGSLVIAREYDPRHGLDFLTIRLPSGRKLYYAQPHMGVNRFGSPSLCYLGQSQTTKKWQEVETYGGKLVENITQAVARDCLAKAIERLEAAKYPVVFHVHDEVVIDAPPGRDSLEDVIRILSRTPAWAAGLPLTADGWVNPFYKKD